MELSYSREVEEKRKKKKKPMKNIEKNKENPK
jgi:hypothetical protein